MATPYEGSIGMIYWDPSSVGESTIDAVIATMRTHAPNVKSIWIKTSDGNKWQGQINPNSTKPDLTINGVDDIRRWVQKCAAVGIDVHGWCVLNGLDLIGESALVVKACRDTGLKSMVLDIEVGPQYFRGGPEAARELGKLIRRGTGGAFHIGLCLDYRGNHPRDVHIDEWFPFINSLHPMVYWHDFGTTPEDAIGDAFRALGRYNRPIIPMLQAYGLRTWSDVPRAADAAFRGHGAEGVSVFRFGTINIDGFAQIRLIQLGGGDAPDPNTEFDFTNGKLIEAITKAARSRNADPEQWITATGLQSIRSRPNEKYRGLAPEQLPGLTDSERTLVIKALAGEVLNPTPDGIGQVTNQQVINAFSEVAGQIGQRDRFWDYVTAAGIGTIADARQSVYNGPAINKLPNLTDDFKARLINILSSVPVVSGSKVLAVPWISQLGAGAPGAFDCGQACVLMLLKYHQKVDRNMQVNQLTNIVDGKTNVRQLSDLARRFGLSLSTISTDQTVESVDRLKVPVTNNRPLILLVNYADLGFPVHLVSGINQGWHWLVVVGYSGDQMIVHDPLWTKTSKFPNGGAGLFITRRTLATAIRPYPALY